MTDVPNAPVTRADLDNALTNAIDGLRAELITHGDEVKAQFVGEVGRMFTSFKDEIIRAIKVSEEIIRKEVAYAEEVSAIDTRLKRVEEHVGLSEQ